MYEKNFLKENMKVCGVQSLNHENWMFTKRIKSSTKIKTLIFSTSVLMHGGLLCIASCLSVYLALCLSTKVQAIFPDLLLYLS